jgi:hypothetical protein
MTARGLRRLTAAALCALTMAVALWSQRDVGLARDELVYMGAGDGYARWWIDAVDDWGAATSKAKITAAFGGPGPTDHNREHPPLMKTLFGFSKRLLHDRLEVASPTTAYRAPSALLHGILIAIVFLWAAAVWGFAEGLIAALLTLALPRALFHAGLAAFDGPIATLWVATLYCYWRALASWRWAPIAGVVWGLALATKHNALLLPLVIAPHFVWVVAADAVTRARAAPGRGVAALGRALWARLYLPPALIVLGPLTLFALWPWLWLDPIDHVRAWLEFHLRHVHYNFEYLGDNWNHPPFPWHVALVTTALTVPAATLAAAALGVARPRCVAGGRPRRWRGSAIRRSSSRCRWRRRWGRSSSARRRSLAPRSTGRRRSRRCAWRPGSASCGRRGARRRGSASAGRRSGPASSRWRRSRWSAARWWRALAPRPSTPDPTRSPRTTPWPAVRRAAPTSA